ncbi:MAG: zinc ABC transporter substrate-binding protein, partial [Demequina sp.]
VDALTEVDPAGEATYRANAQAYIGQVREVATELDAALATIDPAQRVLVTCEGAFSYLAADAGLEEYYLWPVNAESQATAQSVRAAIDVVRERDVPAVFCESTVNPDSMESVAAE